MGDNICIEIAIINDDILESEEQFRVTVDVAQPSIISISTINSSTVVTISEDPNDGMHWLHALDHST